MAAKGSAIEENTTLMNGNNKKEIETEETFAKFLYNKENGTVLGRTAKSWCQITVFYIIFYTCLAAFWVACLAIFLNTLDPKEPRYYGKGTIIGINPGVGYQPWLKENPDSTLIKFNVRDNKTYSPYVDQLKEYLKRYDSSEGTRVCNGNESNSDLGNDADVLPCRFTLKEFESNGCGAKDNFGFKDGSPCVVLSLNRLIGWEPLNYPAESVPEVIEDRYKEGSIAIYCDGTTDADKENIGKPKYIPPQGIDGKYYPYKFVPHYQQPIAMVKFEKIPKNKLVFVECRAYASNIEHDISTRLGMVHFEMFVEDKQVVASTSSR